MNEEIVGKLFPEMLKKFKEGKCTTCGNTFLDLRDKLSVKEYEISGMCQKCQDNTFKKLISEHLIGEV